MKINLTIDTDEINEAVEKAISNEINKRVKAEIQEILNHPDTRDWMDQCIRKAIYELTNKNIDSHVAEIIENVFTKELSLSFRYDPWTKTKELIGSFEEWLRKLENDSDFKQYLDNIVANTAINHPEFIENAIDRTAFKIKNRIQDYVKKRNALMESRRFK